MQTLDKRTMKLCIIISADKLGHFETIRLGGLDGPERLVRTQMAPNLDSTVQPTGQFQQRMRQTCRLNQFFRRY